MYNYCTIDKNNIIQSTYTTEVKQKIDKLIELDISQEDLSTLIGKQYIDSTTIVDYVKVPETVDEAKDIKKQALREVADNLYYSDLENFSLLESSSFTSQELDYKAYKADETAPTPTVDAIAEARGIDRVVLLEKIGTAVEARNALVGWQQRVEDLINACETIEEVDVVNITPPETV